MNNTFFSYQKANQRGQVLLIVVLVMVVALTVGLAVISRTITNIRTSTEENESQRAFSAAEAGAERAIKTGGSVGDTAFATNTSFNTTVTSIRGNSFLPNGGNLVPKDDGVDIWLSVYPGYGTPLSPSFFSIYWSSTYTTDCTSGNIPAALEVIIVKGTYAAPTFARSAYDPCASTRNNNFSTPQSDAAGYSLGGKTFYYRTDPNGSINVSGALLVRVVPLYTNTILGISTCDINGANCVGLPIQGKLISSTGVSGSTHRVIKVFQGYPKVPSEFFQHGIFTTQ